MNKAPCFRRFLTVVLATTFALPMSAIGESGPREGTELAALARELERVLGKGSIEIRSGSAETSAPRPIAEVRERGIGPESRTPDTKDGVLAEMNRERARRGLAPLQFDARLNAAAADRASDMFARRYFDHVSPDGKSPFLAVQKRGYRYATAGENLAVGYRTPQSVVAGWMASPGHRANVLEQKFEEVGLAVVDGSPVKGYGGLTVVALYAREQ